MQDPRAETILDLIAENASIERSRLQPETTLDELGITSLTLIEAVFEIETRYDVEISVDGILMSPEVTVAQLMERVLATIDAKSGAAQIKPAP
ncbi:MAG: acyl carrier protein [Burkholderiales bacterium]|nr:acyl carrier protein [Burkholderiales bacterium]